MCCRTGSPLAVLSLVAAIAAVLPVSPASAANPGRGVRHVPVPAGARAVSTSHADHVIGHGTPAGCTSNKVVAAVQAGGVIRFACGPRPVTIRLKATAKVSNTSRRVVLDGAGLVTLSGERRRRILYMDTCDNAQTWTTSHCQDQAEPQLIVQNLNFVDGNSTGQRFDGGGGAIFDRGGRLRIVNSRFVGNRCESEGRTSAAEPSGRCRSTTACRCTPSRFTDNVCSNGGALSSIGVSWTVLNSLLEGNRAVGHGANPARPGTPAAAAAARSTTTATG